MTMTISCILDIDRLDSDLNAVLSGFVFIAFGFTLLRNVCRMTWLMEIKKFEEFVRY